ncbi:molybdopterin-binding protein [Sutterella sp.]|uniref:molybdopterin-binding protein n=1 Tax=Sutterella sp. TaxID=1981025 RepID=UPI0026E0C464|nr:molybdopterin-binding protein [Sutterella sp.]MDO5530578.1 molybdopterin-binding protein [Sutterella sp.]
MKSFLLRPFELPQAWREPEPQITRLCESFGASLAEDITAEADAPAYDMALRDGWAVCAADAAPRVIDAGSVENGHAAQALAPGHARWVNTGGPVPAGADAVIAADDPADTERAQASIEAGRHVMRAGAEWRCGDPLIRKGTPIGAAEMALLLEAGIDRVRVLMPPEVGVIATGNELKDLYCQGEPGPLRVSSNSCYLRSLLLSLGVKRVHTLSAPDDEEEIARALAGLARRTQFILTIGGTGGGLKDLTRRAILAAGGRIFDETRCRGGALPFIAAEIGGVPVLGLPGNPLGAMMIAQRAALPLIWSRFHAEPYRPQAVTATFGGDIPEAVTGELCVSLRPSEAGLVALPVEKGTGCARLFREAGGVIVLRGESLRQGEQVIVERFAN